MFSGLANMFGFGNASNANQERENQPSVPQPAPTNPLLEESKPQAKINLNKVPEPLNRSKEQYEYNTYRYSTLNDLNFLGDPNPTYSSNIASTNLQGADNLGCNLNDGNCAYNTNLPI